MSVGIPKNDDKSGHFSISWIKTTIINLKFGDQFRSFFHFFRVSSMRSTETLLKSILLV